MFRVSAARCSPLTPRSRSAAERRAAPRRAAQRRDERVDETAAEALPLQLRQQVDVQVRGIGVAERLRTGAADVRVSERAVLTGAALIEG